MIVVTLMGSVQLFVLGIIGQYLGRIHEQVREDPFLSFGILCVVARFCDLADSIKQILKRKGEDFLKVLGAFIECAHAAQDGR